MQVDKSKIGLTFSDKRQSRPTQESILRGAGAQHIRAVGKECATWREAVKGVRPGDVVYIVALVQVATERGDDKLPPSGQPAEFILEVHERGASVIETWTGRNSRNQKERREMVAEAVRSLRGGGRKLPPSGKPAGRPANAFSAEALEHNKKCWLSRSYATNGVAVEHMKEGMQAHEAWRKWGKSGRPWPSKKPFS